MHELSKFQEPAPGQAREAVKMLSTLRARLADGLSALSGTPASSLTVARWLRDAGVHGGGDRVLLGPAEGFCTASLNISQVHYDDLPDRRLGSATALSCIVHPTVPEAPSMHMHLSWTEMKGAEASGSWRLMADLNPSHEVVEDTAKFRAAMEAACAATAVLACPAETLPSIEMARLRMCSSSWSREATMAGTCSSKTESGCSIKLASLRRRSSSASWCAC